MELYLNEEQISEDCLVYFHENVKDDYAVYMKGIGFSDEYHSEVLTYYYPDLPVIRWNGILYGFDLFKIMHGRMNVLARKLQDGLKI